MAVESLATQLRTVKYSPSEEKWFNFIQDHKEYLKSVSKTVYIDVNLMNSYKFRPKDFLSYLNIKYDVMWVILLINKILDPTEFVNKDYILIPDESTIYDLRIRYSTYIKKDS